MSTVRNRSAALRPTLLGPLGPFVHPNPARRAASRKVAVVVFTAFMVIWVVLTLIGFAFRGPDWAWVWPWQEWHGEL